MALFRNQLKLIQQENPAVRFLTTVSIQQYPASGGNNTPIDFNCKDLTIRNDADFELIISGSITLQPGESFSIGADEGEYIIGSLPWRWGAQIGAGTDKFFSVIRKLYAE